MINDARVPEPFYNLLKDAAKTDIMAQYVLADLYDPETKRQYSIFKNNKQTYDTKKDGKLAYSLYVKAADKGNPLARFRIAKAHIFGELECELTIEKSNSSVKDLKKLINMDCKTIKNKCAKLLYEIYENGNLFIEADNNKANYYKSMIAT